MARHNIMNYKSLPIDLDIIASDMAQDSLKEIKELFFIEGAYSPVIRWCIASQSDWPKTHRTLFQFWQGNPAYTFNPQRMISEEVLQGVKESLLIVNFHADQNDFSYAWIGSNLKGAGFPFKENKSLFQSSSYQESITSLFQFTCFGACILRVQPLLTMYQQSAPTGPQVWSTLIVPFVNQNGQVSGLIASSLCSK